MFLHGELMFPAQKHMFHVQKHKFSVQKHKIVRDKRKTLQCISNKNSKGICQIGCSVTFRQ